MNIFIYAPILYQKRYTYRQDPGLQKVLHSCILLQQESEDEIQTGYWWEKRNHFIQYNILASNHSVEPLALVTWRIRIR